MTARHRVWAELDEFERHRGPGGAGAGALGDPLPEPHGGEGRLEALLSSLCWIGPVLALIRVSPHVSNQDVGELPLVGAAVFTCCGALGQEGLGRVVHARLGDVDDVQDAVDLSVAGKVEAIVPWLAVALSGGDGHRCGAAPSGELGFGA